MTVPAAATVSIIVPTFNRARYLPATLDSLLRQSQAPRQVIVVNDGCSDDTEAVLQPYAERIVYLKQANGGKCAAINHALAHVCGKYIWVFDDDDLACEDALARHVAVLERRREVGYTISGSYRCNHDPVSGELHVVKAQPVRPFADDEDLLELLLSSYIAGPSTMIRAALIAQVGRYREDLVRADDFEMAVRLALVSRPGRLDEARPSYYRRWHPGLRGPQGQQFAFAESVARSRAAECMVLRDMAAQLPASRYLPRTEWQAPLVGERRCRAHLRRWVVAVQKGMWPEASAEFEMLCALRDELARLSAVELQWATRALSDMNTLLELAATVDAQRTLAAMLREPAVAPLRRAALKQFYYHLRAAVRDFDGRRVRFMLALGWSLLGAEFTKHDTRAA